MSSGGFVDRALDRIPGYKGYRDKESRRDTDRAIRDKLVLEYRELAERMQRIATRLADERKIMLIGVVDKPLERLNSFIDRLNTATYGYAPIFANDTVDAAALDQLAAFDQSLADQQDELSSQIGEFEAADPASDDFKRIAGDIAKTVDGLMLRFDKRNEVIHGGKPLAEPDVISLLQKPGTTQPPVAYRLHERDAVAYGGVNYTIVGRITVNALGASWRLFQLTGGDNNQWLQAPVEVNGDFRWLRRVAPVGEPGAASVQVEGATYNQVSSGKGTAEVIGQSGDTGDRPVQVEFYTYAGPDTAQTLHVYAFGAGPLALLGRSIAATDIDVFSREQ